MDSGLGKTPCKDPRVLILGSFPSRMSLIKAEYYGNPRNQFWTVMENLFSLDRTIPYEERILALGRHHVILWDVIRSCNREGSGDSRIKNAVQNNIPEFIDRNPGLRLVALNGATARNYFERGKNPATINIVTLPSTSPAHARITVGEKTRLWRIICSYAGT